jgi:hypothetical protein
MMMTMTSWSFAVRRRVTTMGPRPDRRSGLVVAVTVVGVMAAEVTVAAVTIAGVDTEVGFA